MSINADAERQALRRITAVKLIYRVEPRTVRFHIQLFAGELIEQVKRLSQIRSKPDEIVANLCVFVIAMCRNRGARIIINYQHPAGRSKWKRLDELDQHCERFAVDGSRPDLAPVNVKIIVRHVRQRTRQPYFPDTRLVRRGCIEPVFTDEIISPSGGRDI